MFPKKGTPPLPKWRTEVEAQLDERRNQAFFCRMVDAIEGVYGFERPIPVGELVDDMVAFVNSNTRHKAKETLVDLLRHVSVTVKGISVVAFSKWLYKNEHRTTKEGKHIAIHKQLVNRSHRRTEIFVEFAPRQQEEAADVDEL
jgi:hypothetical protein